MHNGIQCVVASNRDKQITLKFGNPDILQCPLICHTDASSYQVIG